MSSPSRSRDAPFGVLAALAMIGLGLVVTPAVFQMFSRAPKGGEMIDEFRPFMTRAEVVKLRGFLDEIDRAVAQTREQVDPAAGRALNLDEAEYREQLAFLSAFEREWSGIDADMSDMLDRMEANLDNYAGVDALPPFPLFPWFFVAPGVMVALAALLALRARRRGRESRAFVMSMLVLGIGIVAAPAVFQMFSRAPGGGEMIDDFRSLMTREKVTTIQGYFITIGNGEAEIRNVALPAAALDDGSVPAVERFSSDWPRINSDMGPVVGVMADNLDNYAAVDALPPFALFPWFFVAPGLLIVGLSGLAWKSQVRMTRTNDPS